MGVKVTNNAFGTISAGINSSATTVTLDSGQGARFPTLGGSDHFYGTLIDTSNNVEIIKVTARSTDSMTVVRAQDNTTARAFAIGDRFELRPTAKLFEDIISEAAPAANSITATELNISGNGTSGQAVLTDGDGSFSYGDAGGGLQSQQVFTSSGTYTKPSGIKLIKVYVTGGGGGGAGGDGGTNSGGGGGAGGTAIEIIDVSSLSSTVAVTIGAAGSGGSGGSNGSSGSTTSFGSYCSATGGAHGSYWNNNDPSGRGGSGSGGDINLDGGDGAMPHPHDANDDGQSAHGGASYWGGGGQGAFGANGYSRTNSTNGQARTGRAYGSGGGGGGHNGNVQELGAAGKAGIVVVEEYK
jgi:hypothetical protein